MPFVLELRQRDPRQDGSFTPEAAVLLPPELRGSGLLAALSPEDLQVLLFVLACVNSNGGFTATPELAGDALGIAPGAALARLRGLAAAVWRQGPLLYEQQAESGLRLFVPSAQLFAVRHVEVREPGASQTTAPVLVGHRAAVVAHSRATYGRPRAEVEAEIERFLLNEPEPSTPEEAALLLLRRSLLRTGVTIEQADRLLADYAADEIQRQLNWLPLRRARNPAGYLIAAIEGEYEAPPSLRKEAAVSSGFDAAIPNGESGGPAILEAPGTEPGSEAGIP